MKKDSHSFISLILFSFMLYMVPALGNPVLFAPINIFLTVFVLIILRNIELKNVKKNIETKLDNSKTIKPYNQIYTGIEHV